MSTVVDRREPRVRAALYAVGGVLAAVVFVAPLTVAVIRSLQPNAVITAAPDSRFLHLTLGNFGTILHQPQLYRAILNSLVVSVGAAVLTSILATFAGYGFARFRFRGRGALFGALLVTMMVPFQAILTPLYLELNTLHLTDSLVGLILFYSTMNLPFSVFVLRTSFATVPAELEDSGHIDGAGTGRMLVSVLRPLVTPGIATAALYTFLASWTEFLGALTFLTNQNLYTLPVMLVNLQQGAYGQVDFGVLAAGAVIAMIPCIALYAGLQRYYVSGLVAGSVKG
jgi:multiple sugar transport system permease protein